MNHEQDGVLKAFRPADEPPIPEQIAQLSQRIGALTATCKNEVERYWLADTLRHLAQAEEAAVYLLYGNSLGLPKHHCEAPM